MAYTQVITPNPDVSCTPGYCLKYVQETFGIGPVYPTATAAFNASSSKHRDQDFPAGCWVPVWFSLQYEPAGHVALRAPDGSIYSSSHPTSTTPTHHASLAGLITYYAKANPLTYLGWTEDVEGVLVVGPTTNQPSQGGDMPAKINLDTARILTHGVLARNGLSGRQDALDGSEDGDLTANHVGQDLTNEYVQGIFLSAEGRQWRDSQDPNSIQGINARLVQSGQLQRQLATEQSKGVGLAKNLDDSQLQLNAANEELKQAESLAADDAGKINDLTVQLAAANATIQQLKAADKPEPKEPTGTVVPSTSPSNNPPITPQQTSTWIKNVVAWLVSAMRK